MSVEVAPTDAGQPQLPMTLRPQPAPAHPGRARQCPSPGADARQRPTTPAADPGQHRLPISLRSSTSAAARTRARSNPGDVRQPELPLAARASVSPTGAGQAAPAAQPQPLAPATFDAKAEQVAARRPAAAGLAAPARCGPAEAEQVTAPSPGTDQPGLPMSLRPPASPAAAGLLAQARRGLAEAERETDPAERFIGAYLAALRGAAAVLAARGRPHRGRARPASTWVLLDSVVPELREWSAFFASNSAARAAAQAGITGKVTAESAAELVRAAAPFLELVRRLVHGLPNTGEAHVA
ncbi:SAV_6107 family HEPN domain-containing protein [Amycolatopsis australiensis]|uniref:SAV-6107-like HEPN domain-containing protein n=1 Tax=Amycolatopsis australiensis TaxID=546364 RepID=A0A1K1T127_9PSEU|nr:SAV_6107 family HEPN domain-containing protein [Amycolatopsis australiensis]SFW90274.1 hypothetical protein SAMN04489730_7501 [Amycolatopsis australiensis]